MITDIKHTERWNSEGKCWDAELTWKHNGELNKIVAGNKSENISTALKLLVEAQVKPSTVNVISYRGKHNA